MLRNIWKKLTGQEHLYHIEHKLQKKMLKCENEEEWKKFQLHLQKQERQWERILSE